MKIPNDSMADESPEQPAVETNEAAPEPEAIRYPPRVVSGVQPWPSVHIGQYFGALQLHVLSQHEYPGDTFITIADYHALTKPSGADRVRTGVLDLAAAYLAFGLDPTKAHLYRQSDVPQCAELAWLLACYMPSARLQQNPPYREAARSGGNPSAGFLNYPVLMAADVYAQRGTIVPVGRDQAANLRHVRYVGRQFNRRHGTDTLAIPEPKLLRRRVIPGTDGRKMHHGHRNAITVFQRFDELFRAVKKIKTGSENASEKKPADCTVLRLYELVASPEQFRTMERQYAEGGISYLDAKRQLTFALQEYFEPYEEAYAQKKRDRSFVQDVLLKGAQIAREQAMQTLEEVREVIGLSTRSRS